MWIIRHLRPRAKQPSGPVRFRGVLTKWDRVRWDGAPGTTYGAHVPNGHADADAVRAMMRDFPSTSVVEDGEVSPLSDTPVAVSVTSAGPDLAQLPEDSTATQFGQNDVQSIADAVGLDPSSEAIRDVLHLCNIVRANGWGIYDFRGAGKLGDPGEAGGRGGAGLTLTELSLTRPPIDWDDLRAAGRPPWESADWTPPAIVGWVPPSWPEKTIDPDKPSDLKPGEITDREGYEAAKAAGRVSELGGEQITNPGPTLIPNAQADSTPPEEGEKADEETSSDEDGPLAGYPEESAAQTAAVVQDLAKRQEKVPHPNAVNFFLKTAGLPHVNKAQIAALMNYKLPT